MIKADIVPKLCMSCSFATVQERILLRKLYIHSGGYGVNRSTS